MVQDEICQVCIPCDSDKCATFQWLTQIRRELEQELVPEWRAKYLDYKVGRCYHNFMYHSRTYLE